MLLEDASPDESATILRNFVEPALPQLKLRLIRNTVNTGIAAAYNRLVQEASAEWVQILDADDYPVEPDFYARIAIELRPERDLLVTAIDSNSQLLRWGVSVFGWIVPRHPPHWLPLLGSFATRAGVIYRRVRLLEQPFPDPAFPGSDVLHFLQLRDDHNCIFLPNAHVYYRVHPEAASSHERGYHEYRVGLTRFDRITRFAHLLDLGLRRVGQRIERPKL